MGDGTAGPAQDAGMQELCQFVAGVRGVRIVVDQWRLRD